jgi:hypothetical protein
LRRGKPDLIEKYPKRLFVLKNEKEAEKQEHLQSLYYPSTSFYSKDKEGFIPGLNLRYGSLSNVKCFDTFR